MELDEIIDTFEFLDDWEDKYRLVIDLGKDLPELADTDRTDANLVRGCQSQVWLVTDVDESGRLKLAMDSDAHIVRGLIAILLAALNARTPQEILAYDTRALFDKLGLLTHLSAARGNGLMSMLERIRSIAQSIEASST